MPTKFGALSSLHLLLLSLLSAALAAPVVQLDAFGDHSIRVRMVPAGYPMADPAMRALLPNPPAQSYPTPPSVTNAPPIVFGAKEESILSSSAHDLSPLRLTNGNLVVSVDGSSGFVTATRVSDGKVLLRQVSLSFDNPYAHSESHGFFSATAVFAGTAGEKIYGLGEHRTGKVQQMGFSIDFRTSQYYPTSHGSDVMIPYYGSSLGYGFLWSSAAFGNVSLTEQALTWSLYSSTVVDFWITTTAPQVPAGVSPLAVLLQHYADAVGHAVPMPYYTTGFWQCKNRYRQQDQLLAVARGYVSRGLPISIIVIDYYHWVHFGDWSFNPACWPDVPGMVEELNSMGIELAVTFWPLVAPQGTYFDQFNKSGFLLKNFTTGAPAPIEEGDLYCTDDTNPAARQAIFDAFWKGYGQYGIRTLWLDATEPEHGSGFNFGQFRLYTGGDMAVGEAWVREHARTFHEGFATKGLGPSDFVSLGRSSWSGSSALSSAVWSGDIQSTFAELLLQMKSGQGFALSGQALWTTDIGGYSNGDPTDPVFQELIVRWFQFGAFCPLFRLHGERKGGPPVNECGKTNGDNEVWNLATDPDHYEGIVRVMELREDLRNYVATINREAAATGMPMMRAMVLAFPDDPLAQGADVEDQFMFGPDWLVAPVYEYKATSRSVYLPVLASSSSDGSDGSNTAGATAQPTQYQWVYWWNQSMVFSGGQRVTMATPINEFPLFWRQPIPPLDLANMTALYSPVRREQVLCVSQVCHDDQVPDGNYVFQRVEGQTLIASSGSVVWKGVNYTTLPLSLWYSDFHKDNFVSTITIPPDNTYTFIANNGYVFATQAPGTVPLNLWFKEVTDPLAPVFDYASVASAAGGQWVATNDYMFIKTIGYVWPAE